MDDGQHTFYWRRTQGKKYKFPAPHRENDMVVGMKTHGKYFELFSLNPVNPTTSSNTPIFPEPSHLKIYISTSQPEPFKF